ncbi:MAG: hypothetical protein ACFCBU_15150, partial [Cyanophyceae cyanobacterium]
MIPVLSKNIKVIATLLLASSILTGCYSGSELENTATTEAADDSKIEAVKLTLEENTRTMNEEDLGGHMETLDVDSPGFNNTKEMLEQLFEVYDLESKVEIIEVVESSPNTVKVRVKQTTTKISGPEFRNNELTVVHTLNNKNGAW